MRRFIKLFVYTVCIYIGFCGVGQSGRGFSDTINIHWLNEDRTIYDTTSCTVGGNLSLPTPTPTKRGYTFVGWETFFTQIEYIESTGTQWIDTGWWLPGNKNNFVLSMTFDPYTSNTTWSGFCGVNNSNNSGAKQYYMFQVNYDGSYLVAHNTDADTSVSFDLLGGIRTVTMSYDNETTTVSYNGQTKSLSGVITQRGTAPLWIFATNVGERPLNTFTKMRLYAFSISVDNILVRDFIPVLDGNGVACLFDKVSKTLFYNRGTGTFIAGPVIAE